VQRSMPQTQLLVDSPFVACVPAVCLEVPSARQRSSALKRSTGNFAHCLTHDKANRRRPCDLSWNYKKLWALRAIGAQMFLAKQYCMPCFDVPCDRHADGLRIHLLVCSQLLCKPSTTFAVQLTSRLARRTDDTHHWQMFKCNQNASAL